MLKLGVVTAVFDGTLNQENKERREAKNLTSDWSFCLILMMVVQKIKTFASPIFWIRTDYYQFQAVANAVTTV